MKSTKYIPVAKWMAGIAVLSVCGAQAQNAIPYNADQQLVYKKVEGRELRLFVYKPAGWSATDRRPALVYIHGGGWVGGSPGMVEPTGKPLLAEGMVVFSVEYRLAARVPRDRDPALCIEDAKSAMRYVRSHAAEFGIDPARIAAGGSSAGGHLSAACALLSTFDAATDDLKVSCKPDALVLLQPVLDNGSEGGYGATFPTIKNNVKAYSPAHNVADGAPPAVVFGGRGDRAAQLPLLEKFTANMKAAGNDCELLAYDGVHGFVGKEPALSDINRKTVAFFQRLGWLPVGPPIKAKAGPAGQ
jgi:acetyl esterase